MAGIGLAKKGLGLLGKKQRGNFGKFEGLAGAYTHISRVSHEKKFSCDFFEKHSLSP